MSYNGDSENEFVISISDIRVSHVSVRLSRVPSSDR